ncbi:hypothetical protein LEP1GSC188_4825 [Leptospira weilii serovar Topaz str. LT2116]|uniref:Uncharacterized protein n=1 Tax=Leptospira weilii serovar Topaz str. LT2116 TaxID=1088540 RepID=M3H0X2_9LEPT|nr:hypothetical protein LEP1GSC188_4825 [Leptospira weilii serovar Topaz str. LT2116]
MLELTVLYFVGIGNSYPLVPYVEIRSYLKKYFRMIGIGVLSEDEVFLR